MNWRDPEEMQARSEMAALYRKIRRDNPPMARLLYRRMRQATDDLAAWFWNQPSSTGGLADLLK